FRADRVRSRCARRALRPRRPDHERPRGGGLLERGIGVARAAGFEAEPLLVNAEHKTSRIIVSLAEEHDAPLIVMGQRKRSAVGTLILAREVLGVQHGPVLLVGPGS